MILLYYKSLESLRYKNLRSCVKVSLCLIVGPDGDTLVSSYGNDTLVEVPYPPVATNELTEALRLASPGSKVEILLSTDSLKLKKDRKSVV